MLIYYRQLPQNKVSLCLILNFKLAVIEKIQLGVEDSQVSSVSKVTVSVFRSQYSDLQWAENACLQLKWKSPYEDGTWTPFKPGSAPKCAPTTINQEVKVSCSLDADGLGFSFRFTSIPAQYMPAIQLQFTIDQYINTYSSAEFVGFDGGRIDFYVFNDNACSQPSRLQARELIDS